MGWSWWPTTEPEHHAPGGRPGADLALRLGPPAGSPRGARQVGVLASAVYARAGADPGALPWTGLDAALVHLPEARHAERAAGRAGVRHRASRVEMLCALAAAGAAQAVLPHLVGAPAMVLRPLWLVGHPDEDSPHVSAVGAWIEALVAGMDEQRPRAISVGLFS